ncbi:MAG: hypothetical protein AAGT88_07420 [Dethiobacter sp.]
MFLRPPVKRIPFHPKAIHCFYRSDFAAFPEGVNVWEILVLDFLSTPVFAVLFSNGYAFDLALEQIFRSSSANAPNMVA